VARYRLDVAELYRALDRRRGARGLNWAQVSTETGLAAPLFTRMAHGHNVGTDGLCTLLAWLGEGHAIAFARPEQELNQ